MNSGTPQLTAFYYACYYAVTAMLVEKGLHPHTHSGVRQMFGQYFIKTGIIENSLGKFFTDIYDLRQSGDYSDFIEFRKDDVLDLLEPAQKLISAAENFLIKKVE